MTRPLSVLVLGASLIVLACVLPLAHAREGWPSLWLLAPSGALLAGVALLMARRHDAAVASLFVGLPLGITAVLLAEGARLDGFGTVGLLGACAALVAYGAAVALAVSRASPLAAVQEKGLAGAAPTADDRPRRVLARVWLALGGATAFVLCIVAPTLGTRAELRRSYGAAAEDVEVLVALAGLAAGLLLVTLGTAGAMRRVRRDGVLPPLRRGRLLALVLVAVAAVGLLVLRRMG